MNEFPDPGGPELVSVVIPAHNEESFMASAVMEVTKGMRQRGPFELILVENGSNDATADLARDLERDIDEVRALSMPDPDYGRALRAGLLAAQGSVVAIFDMDFYDLDFFDRAIARIRGTDQKGDAPVIVVATKRGEGSVDTRVWSRRLVTRSFSLLLRYGFGLRVSDTHGMKVLYRPAILAHAQACRFGTDIFDTELI
ncbi:MAG: glycosyltransferase family 2 protein, partial [Pseudonocardiaceae bacterium]